MARKSALEGSWGRYNREMRESPLGQPVDRRRLRAPFMELEHMVNGGAENGKLICTYSDFVEHGMRRASVARYLRECEALGFLEVTQRGGRSRLDFRTPSRYRLTYVLGNGKLSAYTRLAQDH